MKIPDLELFDWLLNNSLKAEYVLAFSNIIGITYEEYHNLTGYSIPKYFDLNKNEDEGAQELKDALVLSYNCEPKNVVTSAGGTEANFLVFLSLLQKGDEVIVEQPSYQPLFITPKILGTHTIYWPRKFENKFQLDTEVLQQLITKKTKLIVITNLHNPSGLLASRDTLRSVSEIARENNVYVLIDEIFLDGAFTSQSSSYGLPNVVVTSSMTKIYGLGGLRTGWIIAPKEVAERCQLAKAHTTAASSYLSEVISSQVLLKARNRFIDRYYKIVLRNFNIVKEWMKNHNHLLDWVEPNGGIVCFPKYKIDISSVNLCLHLLQKNKVLVTPGQFFNLEGHFRLSYGCDEKTLRGGLKALEKGLEELTNSDNQQILSATMKHLKIKNF